jgi:tRNA(Ile)-lysidine synthase
MRTHTALEGAKSIVASTIENHRMLTDEDSVLVAFSGGPDSTALALLLRELGHQVELGHVVHGMSSTSEGNAKVAAQLAKELGLPLHVETLDQRPRNEAEAREGRYHALERVANEIGASSIATGHTLDDEAETVLMRLQRGGFGLGIPAVRENIIRPLRMLRREDTERVCRVAGLKTFVDPTNAHLAFTRNIVRSEVLPSFDDSLVLELARIGEESADSVTRAPATASGLLSVSSDGAILDRDGLVAAGAAAARSLIWNILTEHLKEPASAKVVDEILSKLPGDTWSLDVGEGWSVWTEAGRVFVGKRKRPASLTEFEVPVPSVTKSSEWGITAQARIIEVPKDLTAGPLEAFVDAALISGPLLVRQRRPGDRFRPIGAPGTKKLQDVFVDAKIPRSHRSRYPVFEMDGRIVWVVGIRLADEFKVTAETERVVHIQLSGDVLPKQGSIS